MKIRAISHLGTFKKLMTSLSVISEQRVWSIMTTWACYVWSFTSERGKTYDPILIMTGMAEWYLYKRSSNFFIHEFITVKMYRVGYRYLPYPFPVNNSVLWIRIPIRIQSNRRNAGSGSVFISTRCDKPYFFPENFNLCFPKYWKFLHILHWLER
jgi:hypothetical protein